MGPLLLANDTVYWKLSDLTSRIVAETGIPSDKYHMGKIILQNLKDAPDFVLQIDAATGKSENYKSALSRSVRCALSLEKMGLKHGDVMGIVGHHYLDLSILYFSALYLGIKIAVMDPSFEVFEFKEMLQVNHANIIFSSKDKIPALKEAMKQIDLKAKLVSFDDEDANDVMPFAKFIEECGDVDVYAFKPTNFDPEETIASLMPTSGTTGLPKVVATTHKNYFTGCLSYWNYPIAFDTYFISAPAQWMSSMLVHLAAPLVKFTKIQTSVGYSAEHYVEIINKYRPQATNMTPAVMFSLIAPRVNKKVDFSCFRIISLGGSPVPQQLYDKLQEITPKTLLLRGFGTSEASGIVFRNSVSLGSSGSFGKPLSHCDVRLIDPESLKDITEPHINGELWIRGACVSKGYYNNPLETKAAFVDGWYRTGDIFYRDEQFSFYYVDRLKLLLKYRTFHVSPVELEKVIREHPGVLDVVVVGIPDLECGDLPAACIVPHPDKPPSAQDIKDYVKNKLSDAKQLRGGVIFMDEFPLTVSCKVDRKKVKAIAIASQRK